MHAARRKAFISREVINFNAGKAWAALIAYYADKVKSAIYWPLPGE